MPNYTYKCDAGHLRQRFIPGLGPIRSTCDEPGCTAAARISINEPPQMFFKHSAKGDMRDYREDLARFPGDPRAYVDGPRSLKKLLDTTKREVEKAGGSVRSLSDVAPPVDAENDPDEEAPLFREAYDEAVQELGDES